MCFLRLYRRSYDLTRVELYDVVGDPVGKAAGCCMWRMLVVAVWLFLFGGAAVSVLGRECRQEDCVTISALSMIVK